MRKKIILGVLCFVLVILGVGLFSTKSDKISKNVYVKNINIMNIEVLSYLLVLI